MSSTSCRSRRSYIERSCENSPGSSVIGVSLRNSAHCSRVKMRYGLYCWSMAVRISMTLTFVAPKRFLRKPAALFFLARRLLFQSGHAGSVGQHGFDLFETNVARLQQHQQMKQQIGALGDEMIAVILDRRDHGFDSLFAHLLGALLRTLVEQLASIGGLTAGFGAGVDDGGQVMDRETGHQAVLGTGDPLMERAH